MASTKGGGTINQYNDNSMHFESPGGYDNDDTYDRNYLLNNSRAGAKSGYNQD
jgi:hypothetical protein